jgi:predicted small secreted protein
VWNDHDKEKKQIQKCRLKPFGIYSIKPILIFNKNSIMKKIISVLSLILIAVFLFTACNNDKSSTGTSTSTTGQKEQLAADETYTCTMHNEVMSDHAGKCPKCGMDLVKQKMTDEQKKLKENGNYVKPKE